MKSKKTGKLRSVAVPPHFILLKKVFLIQTLSNLQMELNIEITRSELPLELVFEILNYVDEEDLVYLLTICKSSHRVLKERLYHTILPRYRDPTKIYDIDKVLKMLT